MAEGGEEQAGAEGEDELDIEEGGSKKKLIIVVLAVLLLVGGGAGAYLGGFIGGGDDVATEEGEVVLDEDGNPIEVEGGDDGAVEEGEVVLDEDGNPIKQEVTSEGPIYYSLPEFLVNLNTGGKGVSFLKATIVLEVSNEKVAEKIKSVEPRIVDGFNTYLLELRSTDLVGSAGLYRLREEMMMRVNKAIYPDKIDDILFKEIIVQ